MVSVVALPRSGSASGLTLRRAARASRPVWLPILVFAAFLAAWEALVRGFHLPSYILPAPSLIWTQSLAAGPSLLGHTVATLETTLGGFILSILIAAPIAILIAASPVLSNAIYPALVLTQSVPKVALAPILITTMGANEASRLVVTVLVAFFPLVLSMATGLLAAPPELLELGRSLKITRWQEFWRIRLPSAVPFVFSGLKLAITFAVVGAVVAEFVAAERGLGYLVVSALAFFKTPLAFGALLILAVMGVVLFQAVVVIERVFFPWSVRGDDVRRR